MVGLMGRIPDIREGAARWIRAFEEETVGHLLAVGDIKAILTKTLGVGEMRERRNNNFPLEREERTLISCRERNCASYRASVRQRGEIITRRTCMDCSLHG